MQRSDEIRIEFSDTLVQSFAVELSFLAEDGLSAAHVQWDISSAPHSPFIDFMRPSQLNWQIIALVRITGTQFLHRGWDELYSESAYPGLISSTSNNTVSNLILAWIETTERLMGFGYSASISQYSSQLS
jgi:hypothetical protein